MIHFPKEMKGCYYHNRYTCCWLCWFRIVRAWRRAGKNDL